MTRTGPSGPAVVLPVGLAVLSVAISAAPRILLAAGALPAPAHAFIWSDVLVTYVERLHGNALPYFDAFFEYPPIVGYVSGALVRVTGDAAVYVLAWAILCAAAAGIAALLIARERGSALMWSLSPQLLLYGSMNFDVLAVLFLVSAVALSRARHRYVAIVALALGSLTKAFPALALPTELAALRRSGAIRAATGVLLFGGIIVVVAAPSLLAPHPFTEGASYVGGLTNFDSAWGLILAVLKGIGVTGAEATISIVSAVGAVGMYLWALWRSRTSELARSAALATVAVLLWTKLYSPQYSLWLVPLFALGVLPARAFALLSLADVAIFATVYPLTLVTWSPSDPLPTALFVVLAVGIVLRHIALVMAWVVAPSRTTGTVIDTSET